METEFAHQQGQAGKKSGSNLVYIAAIVAPMLVVLIGIVNSRGSLEPFLYNVAVGGFTFAIFTLLGFYFVMQPIQPRIKKWRQESRHEKLSLKFLDELGELVTQFGELAYTRYPNGIHTAYQSFRFPSLPNIPKRKEESIEEHWIQTLLGFHQTVVDNPINQIEFDLDNLKLSKKSLLLHFAQTFHHLIWTYQHVFVRSYADSCRRVKSENIPRNSKEAYAKFQPKFNTFISSYKRFAKNVNSQMRLTSNQNRLGEYVEDAPPIF